MLSNFFDDQVTPWEQALVHTFVIAVITVGSFYTLKAVWLSGKAANGLLSDFLGM